MDAARRKVIHEAMVRLSDGDRAAFDVLVDHLWPVIFSFAQRALGQIADAEDVAQEAFYRICSRIADFDRSRDALSWAFGIASYEIMSHRRREHRRREVVGDVYADTRAADSASQEEQLIAQELASAMAQLVGTLTQDERESLGLRDDGAAAVSGSALRKRRQRALDRLRGIWRHVYGDS